MKVFIYILAIILIAIVVINVFRIPFDEKDIESRFDLKGYVNDIGTWYQYSHIGNKFQKDCLDNEATTNYSFIEKDEVKVINNCPGKKEKIGYAYQYDNGKLKVSFSPKILTYIDKFLQIFIDINLATGDYYILSSNLIKGEIIDKNKLYYAMIGSSDRKYLWVLVNKKNIVDTSWKETYKKIIKKASKLGFDTSSENLKISFKYI